MFGSLLHTQMYPTMKEKGLKDHDFHLTATRSGSFQRDVLFLRQTKILKQKLYKSKNKALSGGRLTSAVCG